MEPNFTKLVLTQQRFVKKDYTNFHENMTTGFFADNRSWADRQTKKCGFTLFTRKVRPERIIRQVREMSR
jgi:hypothetical protein